MASEQTDRRDRLTTWAVGRSVVVAAALGVAAIVWSWRLQIVAGALQLLGILLTALGVAVVWSLLELLVDKTSDAKRAVKASWDVSRPRRRVRWLRRCRRTTPACIAGHASATSSASAVLSVGHPSVNRDTIADRDWLVFLNDQLDLLRNELRTVQTRHSIELAHSLAAQCDRLQTQMRHELRTATREGWQLVLAGLGWLAVGTIVGMCA